MNRCMLSAWTISLCTCFAPGFAADNPPAKPIPFSQKVEGAFVTLDMLPIPAGKFTPSTADGKAGKEVQVKSFYMSKTEITWDLFDIYAFSFDLNEAEKQKDDALPKEQRSRPSKPYMAPDFGYGHAGYAALAMSPKSAEGFCRWLSAKTGKKYRLPTEVEWEYAARAGGPIDVDSKTLPEIAWHHENAEDKTHSVAELKPNAWGLYDTLGNAAEWCIDIDGKPVTRGGSFLTRGKRLNYALREPPTPKWNDTDPNDPKSSWWLSDGMHVGFRVVCEQ